MTRRHSDRQRREWSRAYEVYGRIPRAVPRLPADATRSTPRAIHRLPLGLALALLLSLSQVAAAPLPVAAAEQCFPQTGQCVSGRFLDHWLARGGLAINGYPLTEPRTETLEDGRQYTVQWFERVRLELHPENPPPYDVLLGQFGRLIHPADAPVTPRPGLRHYPETGHNVPADFAAYWDANGGLAQFGYPLSEVFTEVLEDGRSYEVQYFERARFERHPENAPPANVLLGQFGRRLVGQAWGPTLTPLPGGQSYADPRGRFTALRPQGWTTDLDADGNVNILEPGGNAGINISPRPVDSAVTLDQYRQNDYDYLLPLLRDYRLVSDERVMVGPYPGYKRTFLHTNTIGQNELIVRLHFRAPGYVYVVNCFTLPRDNDRYGPIFDGVTGSITSAR
jgi:hypothetical protein